MSYLLFQKPKEQLYITASWLLKEHTNPGVKNRIKIYQNRIRRSFLPPIKRDKIDYTYTKRGLRCKLEKINDFFVYRYPLDTIHFSAVNFLTFSRIPDKDFQNWRDKIIDQCWFKEFKSRCLEEIQKVNSHQRWKLQIKRIYIPKQFEGSIALNAYVKDSSYFELLIELKKNVEIILRDLKIPNSDIKIKAYPEKMLEYFAINIFRLLGKQEKIIHPDSFRTLKGINKELNSKPIKIKSAKLTLVMSDPYLSNEDPPLTKTAFWRFLCW